jgi:uncharacterized protein (DUF2062 family)
MAFKFLRKRLPDRHTVRDYKWLAWCRHWLDHPNLWALNRSSVAGGFAIGLFSGLIPGPVQMLGAILLTFLFKRNIPVALATTFYTNPFTIAPLYLLAYGYGRLLLGNGNHAEVEPFIWNWSDWSHSFRELLQWAISLGPPLAVGLVALALTLALVGYLAVQLGWRVYVVLAWRARARRRLARNAKY